jgi:hypothetical protein
LELLTALVHQLKEAVESYLPRGHMYVYSNPAPRKNEGISLKKTRLQVPGNLAEDAASTPWCLSYVHERSMSAESEPCE